MYIYIYIHSFFIKEQNLQSLKIEEISGKVLESMSLRVWEPSGSWIEELFLQILQSSIFKPRT